ncbi:MAG: hypothetical protein ABIP06_05385 [Pyrinomonadaceae bacterium]
MMNNNLLKFTVFALCILGFTFSADAQRKTTRRGTTKPKVVTESTIGKTDLKMSAEKVSVQIKNTSKFLYLLGSVANGIETIDKDTRAGKASRAVQDKNTQFKKDVLQSIRNLRAGMIALEVDFRTKPQLQKYLLNIQGISDMSGRAEDLANGGEFVESGKMLLLVVEKLSDTLAALP